MGDFQKMFIDTTMKRAKSGMQRGLMHMGGYIAKTTKNSIKPAEKHSQKAQTALRHAMHLRGASEVYSQPGQPPLSKLGLLRNNIRYGWEEATKSVVIGPVKFNGRGNAPAALELGIPTLVRVGKGSKTKMVMIPMRARPYMRPALAKAMLPENVKKFFKKFMDEQGQSFTVAA